MMRLPQAHEMDAGVPEHLQKLRQSEMSAFQQAHGLSTSLHVSKDLLEDKMNTYQNHMRRALLNGDDNRADDRRYQSALRRESAARSNNESKIAQSIPYQKQPAAKLPTSEGGGFDDRAMGTTNGLLDAFAAQRRMVGQTLQDPEEDHMRALKTRPDWLVSHHYYGRGKHHWDGVNGYAPKVSVQSNFRPISGLSDRPGAPDGLGTRLPVSGGNDMHFETMDSHDRIVAAENEAHRVTTHAASASIARAFTESKAQNNAARRRSVLVSEAQKRYFNPRDHEKGISHSDEIAQLYSDLRTLR